MGRWDAMGRNLPKCPTESVFRKSLKIASHCVPASHKCKMSMVGILLRKSAKS